jgi:hypothetical protein
MSLAPDLPEMSHMAVMPAGFDEYEAPQLPG